MTLIVDYGGEKKFFFCIIFLKFFFCSLNLHFTISHNDIIYNVNKQDVKRRSQGSWSQSDSIFRVQYWRFFLFCFSTLVLDESARMYEHVYFRIFFLYPSVLLSFYITKNVFFLPLHLNEKGGSKKVLG